MKFTYSEYQKSFTKCRAFAFGLLLALALSIMLCAANPLPLSAATIHHYEYVFTPGLISVYDMDNGHALLKSVSVPTSAGVRGAVASTATGMLYISYGSDGNSGGFVVRGGLGIIRDQLWILGQSRSAPGALR
jgi:hypothetical protein